MPAALDDDAIEELPPEMPGGLTFHLPMELAALRDAGAPDDVRRARAADRLAEAWRAGLVDPPMYRWAVERYRGTASDLLSGDDVRVAGALRDVAPLADGLAGAAFHGLIRLGYGVWRRDAGEVARGFAYLRTRRQVLAVDAVDDGPTGELDGDLPTAAERDGVTVFDLLNLAAGTRACTRPTTRSATPRALAVAGASLVRRNPSSFVAVHAATSVHALCELHALALGGIDHDAPLHPDLATWWRNLDVAVRACTLLVESGPPEAVPAYDGARGEVHDLDSLATAAVRSDETHDVKLAVALRRLVGFGVLHEQEALEAGLARLGTGVLGHV